MMARLKMARATVAALLMTAGACVNVVPRADVPPADGPCDAGRAQALVGSAASAELGADALQRTGAREIRWIQPGDMVTMDYRPDRLNIELDARNRVARFTCG